ncbi:hypothetical protein Drorol1_Dr00019859 [Drosera rotundifolia]
MSECLRFVLWDSILLLELRVTRRIGVPCSFLSSDNGGSYVGISDDNKATQILDSGSSCVGIGDDKEGVIHLYVSVGNILLDANFWPLVAEIEISKLLDPSRGTASISVVAGFFGYIPPEYAFTMQVTAPGNVYNYGMILLEILTTRLPIDEAFGEGSDLVKWVHNAPLREETPKQILDARLSTVLFACAR